MNNDIEFDRFGCEEILHDVLMTQKYMSQFYCDAASESSDLKVQNAFMSIQEDEQLAGQELFAEIQKRGWYQAEKAGKKDIEKVKTAFSPENNG